MVLWTIQHYHAYERLQSEGILTANEEFVFCKDDFQFAYDWINQKMISAGMTPPKGIHYPIWAWYQWEGKRKRRDMRESGYNARGEKIVQLTVEIDDSEAMLSDFDLYHFVLNHQYLPINEKDLFDFDNRLEANKITHHDIINSELQNNNIDSIRRDIIKSWDRIFLLEKEDEGWLFGKNNNKSIQASFWELRIGQVVKAEIFIAK